MKTQYAVFLIAFSLLMGGCASLTKGKQEEKPVQTKEPVQAVGLEAVQALLRQADDLYSTRDYEQAEKLYAKVIDVDKKNLRAQYRLGNIAFRNRDWEGARDRYETVIELEPRHARAQYNLSMTYLTLAERHLKFFAANVDNNANLESVSKLIKALEEISNPRSKSASSSEDNASALDKVLDELSKD